MSTPVILTTATTLYASKTGLESHCIRMIMAEKDIYANKNLIQVEQLPRHIAELNPYQMLPILFDRKTVLYDFSVISEYLDERFPFPPMMPVDPIDRAEKRLFIFRFILAEDSLFSLANRILEPKSKKDAVVARKILTSHLISLIPLFEAQPFFKSDYLTIVDVCLAVLLWRLKKMDITLPTSAKPVVNYARRLFAREAFKIGLTEVEKEYCD